ncbi:MAG TPA: sigma-70 family RNA polymerase sigma factor [Polyangia bacterium]|nr:sigma-70 family RNA polymerase sigma factor [Polyangia bacterium]
MTYLRLVRSSPSNASGDDACLVAFQKELSYIHRTFVRLRVPPSEVEDLVQELFLVLRHVWDQYDPGRPIRPYLFGIAFRLASGNQRKRGRETKSGFYVLPDPGPSPEDILESSRARALLLEALDQVPMPRRAVLVMHELDLVPVAEVASALSIPVFTVYSRLRKGRRELDRALRRTLRRLESR